jgi:hypothetical protein
VVFEARKRLLAGCTGDDESKKKKKRGSGFPFELGPGWPLFVLFLLLLPPRPSVRPSTWRSGAPQVPTRKPLGVRPTTPWSESVALTWRRARDHTR